MIINKCPLCEVKIISFSCCFKEPQATLLDCFQSREPIDSIDTHSPDICLKHSLGIFCFSKINEAPAGRLQRPSQSAPAALGPAPSGSVKPATEGLITCTCASGFQLRESSRRARCFGRAWRRCRGRRGSRSGRGTSRWGSHSWGGRSSRRRPTCWGRTTPYRGRSSE